MLNPQVKSTEQTLTDYRQIAHRDHFSAIKCFLEFIGKPHDKITKHDLELWLAQYENEGTRLKNHMYIRRFYKWLNNGNLPEHLYIKCKPPKHKETFSPADIWEEKDILLAIQTRDNDRDKAFLAILFETGGRTHEILELKLSDIAMREVISEEGKTHSYAEVMLRDHTGERPMPIIFSYPYLINWINNHPLKDKKGVSLWVSQRTPHEDLKYGAVNALFLKMKGELSDRIKKPFRSYLLRHSRLTYYADVLTEFQLRKLAGWTQNSKMPSRYLHMSMKGTKDILLEHHGITQKQGARKTLLVTKECPACHKVNALDAKYCVCGRAISIEAFEELKQKEIEKDKQFKEIRAQLAEEKEWRKKMDEFFRPIVMEWAEQQKNKKKIYKVKHSDGSISIIPIEGLLIEPEEDQEG